MKAWTSLKKEFTDCSNSLNFHDLKCALRKSDPAELLKLADQLSAEEELQQEHLTPLIHRKDQRQKIHDNLLAEIGHLEAKVRSSRETEHSLQQELHSSCGVNNWGDHSHKHHEAHGTKSCHEQLEHHGTKSCHEVHEGHNTSHSHEHHEEHSKKPVETHAIKSCHTRTEHEKPYHTGLNRHGAKSHHKVYEGHNTSHSHKHHEDHNKKQCEKSVEAHAVKSCHTRTEHENPCQIGIDQHGTKSCNCASADLESHYGHHIGSHHGFRPSVLARSREKLEEKERKLHEKLEHSKRRKQETELHSNQRRLDDLSHGMWKNRQTRARIDELIQLYTSELTKINEVPREVIQMKLFFQSLHAAGRKRLPFSVALDENTRKLWIRAMEIRNLQEELAEIYSLNFKSRAELTKLLLEGKLLELLVHSESRHLHHPHHTASHHQIHRKHHRPTHRVHSSHPKSISSKSSVGRRSHRQRTTFNPTVKFVSNDNTSADSLVPKIDHLVLKTQDCGKCFGVVENKLVKLDRNIVTRLFPDESDESFGGFVLLGKTAQFFRPHPVRRLPSVISLSNLHPRSALVPKPHLFGRRKQKSCTSFGSNWQRKTRKHNSCMNLVVETVLDGVCASTSMGECVPVSGLEAYEMTPIRSNWLQAAREILTTPMQLHYVRHETHWIDSPSTYCWAGLER